MTDLPPEAITAAALILADVEGDDQTYRDLADDVLRAAAPYIAAADEAAIRADALRSLYADVRGLMRDYSDSGQNMIAAMPFGATLDQLMAEKYGIETEERDG